MAYVIQKKGKRHWRARYRRPDGKWGEASTGTADRDVAMSVASELERAALAQDVVKAATSALQTIVGSAQRLAVPRLTLRQWCDRWLARKARETAPGTHRRYQDALRPFLDRFGDTPLSAITPTDLTAIRDAGTCAPTTANLRTTVIRMALKDATMERLIEHNPARNIKTLRRSEGSRTTRRGFTVPEIEAVLRVAPEHWRGLVLGGLYTGQRLGDLVRLRREQIAGRVLRIRQGKTGTAVEIPLASPFLEWIDEHGGPVNLFAPLHERPVQTLSVQFAAILHRAGLRDKSPHRRSTGRGKQARAVNPLSFHSLRHTTVSLLRLAGAPLAVSQAIAGHRSQAIHDSYTHVSAGDASSWMDALPRVTGNRK